MATLTIGEGDNMVIYKGSETYNSNALQYIDITVDGNPIGDKKVLDVPSLSRCGVMV